ncbi:hypothetical protein [Halobacterium sp. R2-5]|uniref:hypothetical protein n=1 Tax=Halobacterium sp. R2-5 TaxID=2715751 RepID=UPI00141E5471|nr:hypothetical protein [Halobacterium sp. R2-5]NIC00555.1 hypothetical protein [Halobacterium sp. R2-5]
MTVASSLLSVAGWVALTAAGSATLADADRRAQARERSTRWTLVLGVLAGLMVAAAAGLFSVWEQAGVYVLAVAGVVAYAAGVVSALGAAGLADAATGPDASLAGRLQAFWCASSVYFRGTRVAFAEAFLAFALAAIVAGVSVDPLLGAVGALAVGGAVASLTALAAVGVFVPGGYGDRAAERVRAATHSS